MSETHQAIEILPSLLAAKMDRIGDQCRLARASGADALHLDIMDGHFVPNLTFGPDLCRAARDAFDGPTHTHLMVTHPHLLIEPFARAGAETLLIHVEAQSDVADCLRQIRDLGVRPGVTLNPETPVSMAAPWVDAGLAEEILCMSVHPGFGGQAFIENTLPKMAEIRRRWPSLALSVDGGVTAETGPRCAAAGATRLIAGTFLFRATDMTTEIRRLRTACEAARETA